MTAARRNLFLLLTWPQWLIALAMGSLFAALFFPWYGFISAWIGCALFLAGVLVVHLHFSSRYMIPFPQLAILIAGLQYIFAAWFGLYHPSRNPIYFMGDRIVEYLSYAGPVVFAITIGWSLSVLRLPLSEARFTSQRQNAGLLQELDLLGIVGIAAFAFGNVIKIPTLEFALVLLGNLRFVSVFGRMLLDGPGWRWRLAVVLGMEVLFATETAMFHNLLLWSLWTFAIWIFRFRPKLKTTVAILTIAVFLLPALQQAKWRLRADAPDNFEEFEDPTEWTLFEKTVRWFSFLGPSFGQTVTFSLDEDFLAEMGVRYNQGWIVNRIMSWMPDYEPYAGGETVVGAIKASLLPRMIATEKARAGGHENMARFAGLELGENTSMNLGFAGEMYANFGRTNGIIGCGVYALVFGLLFRVICKRAMANPLWWSLVPFIFNGAVKAEDDLTYILNWTVKGSVVLFAVILFLQHFRRALFDRQQIAQRIDAGSQMPTASQMHTNLSALR